MVSLRTLSLWVAVAVLLVTTIVALWIAAGETLDRPLYVALPLLIGSLAMLLIAAIALKRSIDEDHERLGEYESPLFRRLKPLLLLASVGFFGAITVYIGVMTPRAVETESCTELTSAGGASIERCTTDHEYWVLVLIAPFFVSALLITVSSAIAFIRDFLESRAAAAHSH
jgi:hypothetical protein